MSLRHALELSLDMAPAEHALRIAGNTDDLQVAWFTHCERFMGYQREYLQSVYDDRLTFLKAEETLLLGMLGAG